MLTDQVKHVMFIRLSLSGFQAATVEVTEGVESVLLPFITTTDLLDDIRVEWRVTVPKAMTVHVCENGQNQPQDEVYRGRTEMKNDLSLILRNPRVDDGGVYVCTVYKDVEVLKQKRVTLCVKGQCSDPHRHIETRRGCESEVLTPTADHLLVSCALSLSGGEGGGDRRGEACPAALSDQRSAA